MASVEISLSNGLGEPCSLNPFSCARIKPMSKQSSPAIQSPRELDFISHSVAQTIRVGQRLGELLGPGDLILLLGDFGSGKTHLIKGIAQGLGSTDLVNSPSFVLINQYRSGPSHGQMTIYHA